jgi:hypothetical protein
MLLSSVSQPVGHVLVEDFVRLGGKYDVENKTLH